MDMREALLDHYRNPHNYDESASLSATGTLSEASIDNHLCGHHICVRLVTEGDSIAYVSFYGEGCAVSIASASIMTKYLSGKSVSDITAAIEKARNAINGDDVNDDLLSLLQYVQEYPMRKKCAMMAWNGIQKCIGG